MQDKTHYMQSLYEINYKKIFDFLYKFTRNSDLAFDLTQDTFVSFFKSYLDDDLSNEKSIMLLYRIARNHSINFFKKFSTQKENSGNVEEYKSEKLSFETKLELGDMEEKLYQYIESLPEEQKTALLLKNVEGLTLVQISEIMGTSISTVSRLVVKATANLIQIAEKNNLFS